MFSTNAVMGLRTKGTALNKSDWGSHPIFLEFCREFFVYQVETLKPRLLVILGPIARSTIETLIPGKSTDNSGTRLARVGNHTVSVIHTTHPYGDFNFSEERRDRDAECMARAWEAATARLALVQARAERNCDT